jgi:hypothetical protein
MKLRQRAYEIFSQIFKRELIRDGYRGILDRDPEEEALRSYERSFEGLGATGVIRDLVGSNEHWQKIQSNHAEEIISEMYRGILDREPEDKALSSHSAEFRKLYLEDSTNQRIHIILKRFIESEEFYYFLNKKSIIWSKIKNQLITSVYLGLLDREPDDIGKEVYSNKLIKWDDLALVISSIASGKGHLDMMIKERAPEVFADLCEHLLKRKLSSHEIEQTINNIGKSSIIGDLIKGGISKYTQEEAQIKRRNAPVKIINPTRIVFLHAEKTGGTSIQAMLAKSLPKKEILCEHDDTIYWRTPSELNQYRVLCGHFNYDTTKLLTPGKNFLVTMVREPDKRILSLYNFWRAHDETHPNHTIFHTIAWEKGFIDFLNDERIASSRHVWNNMAWYIAGDEIWNQWKVIDKLTETDRNHYITENITPFLRERMTMFSVVGIQEKFAESVRKIYQLLDMEPPSEMLRENSFEGNISHALDFRKNISPKSNITDNERAATERATRIDNIIYEIANNNF